jgi:hypothetical protein
MAPPFLPRTVLLQNKTPEQALRLLTKVMVDDKTLQRLRQTRFEGNSRARERKTVSKVARFFSLSRASLRVSVFLICPFRKNKRSVSSSARLLAAMRPLHATEAAQSLSAGQFSSVETQTAGLRRGGHRCSVC